MINSFTGGLVFPKTEITNYDESDIEMISQQDVNIYYNPVPSLLSYEEKLRLFKEVGEEIIDEDELKSLLKNKKAPICYDGFEPSGRMHIAQGILRSINVNRLTMAGCEFVFWVADWFALMNNKMGGDLDKIRIVGRYFIEIWKAAGMDLRNVKFLWASEEINKRPDEYWSTVIDIARKNTYDRIVRCSQIMGRNEKEKLHAAQIMYPCMQVADIFFLKADICQLGQDQRKVNVLAREYCDDIKKKNKPIIVSHHMIPGLKQDAQKMSKSIEDSAIFMEDSEEDVNRKISSAFCTEKEVTGNPLIDYIKNLIFPSFGKFHLIRPTKWGGDLLFESYEALEKDWLAGSIGAKDLKVSVALAINKLIEPVRSHFQNDPYAKKLLELVRSFQVTR
jgi:tyrosyl-tRNA synthetase